MKRLFSTLSVAILIGACGACSRSSSPTSPSALPTPTQPTSTLSGLVFAETPNGLAPVDGARVRLDIGAFRLDATTDQNGRYTLSGLYEGSSTVSTTRDGYDTDTRQVAISGDVRLDIRIVPRVPHTVSGVVFETTSAGRVPVEGVYVTASWDYTVTTDSNGSFSLSGFYNGERLNLSASRDGYQDVTKDLTIKGDTLLDIQLVRR